ncbi:MAG: hypothetical protein CME68_05685 [Halobacteriovoraceae bacterium]|nr:hypothetical protein [Halobacteriovoraceae bacterium]
MACVKGLSFLKGKLINDSKLKNDGSFKKINQVFLLNLLINSLILSTPPMTLLYFLFMIIFTKKTRRK